MSLLLFLESLRLSSKTKNLTEVSQKQKQNISDERTVRMPQRIPNHLKDSFLFLMKVLSHWFFTTQVYPWNIHVYLPQNLKTLSQNLLNIKYKGRLFCT